MGRGCGKRDVILFSFLAIVGVSFYGCCIVFFRGSPFHLYFLPCFLEYVAVAGQGFGLTPGKVYALDFPFASLCC